MKSGGPRGTAHRHHFEAEADRASRLQPQVHRQGRGDSLRLGVQRVFPTLYTIIRIFDFVIYTFHASAKQIN